MRFYIPCRETMGGVHLGVSCHWPFKDTFWDTFLLHIFEEFFGALYWDAFSTFYVEKQWEGCTWVFPAIGSPLMVLLLLMDAQDAPYNSFPSDTVFFQNTFTFPSDTSFSKPLSLFLQTHLFPKHFHCSFRHICFQNTFTFPSDTSVSKTLSLFL